MAVLLPELPFSNAIRLLAFTNSNTGNDNFPVQKSDFIFIFIKMYRSDSSHSKLNDWNMQRNFLLRVT